MKRGRLKKWAKWVCTAAAAGVLAVAVASGFCDISYASYTRHRGMLVETEVVAGLFVRSEVSLTTALADEDKSRFRTSRILGWYWGLHGEMSRKTKINSWHAGVCYDRDPDGLLMGFSLLYPLVAFSLPAALLWYSDRRRAKPGACGGCGYDRSGLPGGPDAKCPECGAAGG